MRRSLRSIALLVAGAAAGACASTPEREAFDTMHEAVLVAQEGDLERAAELLEQASAERPGFVDPLMFLANVQERLGHPEAARNAYTRALDADPTLTAAGVALALTYVAEGRHDEARTWLERALQADPGFEPTLRNLGTLAERRGDRQAAADWYRIAATLDPTTTNALVRLGAVQLAAGEREAARATAERALARRADDPAARALRAATEQR